MSRPRILVIEDDAAIRRGVIDALEFEGYLSVGCGRGDDGLRIAAADRFDLLLLDLVLPGLDGLDLLQQLREVRPSIPVIILTARGEETERVRGLRLGADDYVVKPFSIRELLARIQAVLRRSPERTAEVRQMPIPGGVVDLARCEVRFDDGSRAELSEREAEILGYLAARSGRTVSRDELLQRIWQIDPRGLQSRTVDMHVIRLRGKLRDDAADPQLIRTVRGKGYLFAAIETVP